MTQVSKYPLRKEIEKRMFEVFLDSIAMVKTRDKVEKLVTDLLSPTEKTMLAKRLSIALLLYKKYDQRSIVRVLKVSLSTVSRISRSLQQGSGGYAMVISSMLQKEEFQGFLDKLDDALADMFTVGLKLPHWRRRRWEEEIQDRKTF